MTKVIINGSKGRMGETLLRCGEANPDIEIVHICTPNHLHKDALLSAMAGITVGAILLTSALP